MICLFFRNDCEMTHFFFSLNREPLAGQKISDMPITFSFDTHIITQININVKHTLFDKVKIGKKKPKGLKVAKTDQMTDRNVG